MGIITLRPMSPGTKTLSPATQLATVHLTAAGSAAPIALATVAVGGAVPLQLPSVGLPSQLAPIVAADGGGLGALLPRAAAFPGAFYPGQVYPGQLGIALEAA